MVFFLHIENQWLGQWFKRASAMRKKKAPFAIIEVRSANCTTTKQRECIQMGLNDINSLSHTRWNCKYHIALSIVI